MSDSFITLWRKTGEECLDWDFHVSHFADEVSRVVENIKKQGVWQYTTYPLGPMVTEYSSPRSSRDTDGSPKGPDPKGLDGEAATAGAEGIAKTGARP